MYRPGESVVPGRGAEPRDLAPEELAAMNPLAGYPDGYSPTAGAAPAGCSSGSCGCGGINRVSLAPSSDTAMGGSLATVNPAYGIGQQWPYDGSLAAVNPAHGIGQSWSYDGTVEADKHQCYCTVYLMLNLVFKDSSGGGKNPVLIKFDVQVAWKCFPILGYKGTQICEDECRRYYVQMLDTVNAWNRAKAENEKKGDRRQPDVSLPTPRVGTGVVPGSSKKQQVALRIVDGQPAVHRFEEWMPFDWVLPSFVNTMTLFDVVSSCRAVPSYSF